MEGRALGKGLSALIPDRGDALRGETIKFVKTSQVRDNPRQPRTAHDAAQEEELVASIKEKGVLQPILVREMPDGYEVIAGERRLRAARRVGLDEVPVLVKKVSDDEALILALVENIQRQDLNAMEEAQAFRKLTDEFGFTHEAIAQAMGKDRSTISNVLRLLKLPAEIQKSVYDGILSEGHARVLVSVENEELQKEIFEYTVKNQLSVRELERLVREGLRPEQHRARRQAAARDEYLGQLEDALQKILGTKVLIKAKKNQGRIVIEYYSPDDLKRIVEIFQK